MTQLKMERFHLKNERLVRFQVFSKSTRKQSCFERENDNPCEQTFDEENAVRDIRLSQRLNLLTCCCEKTKNSSHMGLTDKETLHFPKFDINISLSTNIKFNKPDGLFLKTIIKIVCFFVLLSSTTAFPTSQWTPQSRITNNLARNIENISSRFKNVEMAGLKTSNEQMLFHRIISRKRRSIKAESCKGLISYIYQKMEATNGGRRNARSSHRASSTLSERWQENHESLRLMHCEIIGRKKLFGNRTPSIEMTLRSVINMFQQQMNNKSLPYTPLGQENCSTIEGEDDSTRIRLINVFYEHRRDLNHLCVFTNRED